jgi:hypothetical protein
MRGIVAVLLALHGLIHLRCSLVLEAASSMSATGRAG